MRLRVMRGHLPFRNLAQITIPENLKALGMSLLLSFLSTLICLVLAYPLAMILSQKQVNQTSFIVLIFIFTDVDELSSPYTGMADTA